MRTVKLTLSTCTNPGTAIIEVRADCPHLDGEYKTTAAAHELTKYLHSHREAAWKIRYDDGDSFDIFYLNGEEISKENWEKERKRWLFNDKLEEIINEE